MSNAPSRYGTALVVSPRGLTYSVVCHQWLTCGAWAIRILPTIWVHMWTVSFVSDQSDTRSRGHAAPHEVLLSVMTGPFPRGPYRRPGRVRCRLSQFRLVAGGHHSTRRVDRRAGADGVEVGHRVARQLERGG